MTDDLHFQLKTKTKTNNLAQNDNDLIPFLTLLPQKHTDDNPSPSQGANSSLTLLPARRLHPPCSKLLKESGDEPGGGETSHSEPLVNLTLPNGVFM